MAQEATRAGILGVLVAFCAAVAMWWLYFDREEQVGSKAIEASEEPGRLARAAYTYAHVIIIAGVLLTSVADKEVLAHPLESMKVSTAVVGVGGPFLYLLGLAVFRRVVTGAVVKAYVVALVALLVLGAVSALLTPLVVSALGTAVLVLVAAWGTVTRVRREGTEPAEDEG